MIAEGYIRFGATKYFAENGRLVGPSGEEVLLRSQSERVLAMLASNLGKVVSREKLFSNVWADVAVTDDSLTQCIADIRRALGDKNRSILKTIHKRGYLLAGTEIKEVSSRSIKSNQEASQSSSNREEFETDGLKANLDPRDILPTLAILPMRGLRPDDQDALCMFVSSELVSALGRSPDMNVISRLSTAQFWIQKDGLTNLRGTLNADFVVSGFVWTEDNQAVLSFEFAETDSQIVLWSDRMTIPISSILSAGDWVEHVVSHIRRALMVNEIEQVRSRALENLQLFSILYGAVGLMHQLSPENFNKARDLLRLIQEKAPHNPVPLAWVARWHVLRAMQGWSPDLEKDAREATAYAERALDMDPENTLALTSLGFVMTNLAHRLDEAKSYYDSAIDINPNDAQARALRGMLQSFCDDAENGKRDTERAIHLTPRDPHRFFYLNLAAGANLSAGNYDRAVVLAKASRRLKRTHVSTLRTLAAAQEGAGEHKAARETVNELIGRQPGLKVSTWLQSSPSRSFENGKRFAHLLRSAGVPA